MSDWYLKGWEALPDFDLLFHPLKIHWVQLFLNFYSTSKFAKYLNWWNLVAINLWLLFITHHSYYKQGRIYVANEHPTYARNVSIVDQKLKILGQIVLNRRQISLFWWKISKFQGKTCKFFNFSAPYCRDLKI